jgi:CHAD domain-containing protein
MSGTISRELLAQPAKRAARVIARARLDDVRDAFGRFESGRPDGLHALRVGLRRLRSWLRAFRPELDDTVRGKTRRRLRDLTHATNEARDGEVWGDWIAAHAKVPTGAQPGLRYTAKWLRAERDAALRKSTKRVRTRLPRLLDALERELSSYNAPVAADGDGAAEATMAEVIAELIARHHQRFTHRIDRADSPKSVTAIHRCRIAAKRLRYLLEALTEFPTAEQTTAQLVELQDALGTVRDLRLFVGAIVERVGVIAMMDARRRAARALSVNTSTTSVPDLARVRPGMLLLAKRARREADDAFAAFRAAWDHERLASLGQQLDHLIESLSGA